MELVAEFLEKGLQPPFLSFLYNLPLVGTAFLIEGGLSTPRLLSALCAWGWFSLVI